MRTTVRRHLGKVVAGAAVAVAATAAMIAITLPGTAGAEGTGGGSAGRVAAGGQDAAQDGAGQRGGAAAVAPGVVERAPAEGERGTGRDPLTDDEIARVERIALNRQLLDASRDVDGDRGPQHLGVDLAEPGADEVD
ncbi:Tat pathway signal sequence domain protein, partial [Streptomyces sp. NPDC057052]